jgi:hypothetical protein
MSATELGAYLLATYGVRGLKGPLFPDAEKWAEEDERRHAERALRSQIYARKSDVEFAEQVVEAAKDKKLREILVIALGMPYLDLVARDVLAEFPEARWDHGRRTIRLGDRGITFKVDDDLHGTTCGRSYDKILMHPLVSWVTYVSMAPCEQPTDRSLS